MQPDSNQPQESAAPAPEPAPVPAPPPAPTPAPAPMPVYAPVQPKKPRSYLVLAIVLGVFMSLFCLTAAGLGYWGNTLKTDLASMQGQLTDLQGNYETLQADNEKLQADIETLNADLAAVQAELDATKKELETTQADLKSAREQSDNLQTKIDAALLRMDVVLGIFVDFKNEKGVERDIRDTGDEKLLEMFQLFIEDTQNDEKWFDFLAYLFESIVDELQ